MSRSKKLIILLAGPIRFVYRCFDKSLPPMKKIRLNASINLPKSLVKGQMKGGCIDYSIKIRRRLSFRFCINHSLDYTFYLLAGNCEKSRCTNRLKVDCLFSYCKPCSILLTSISSSFQFSIGGFLH